MADSTEVEKMIGEIDDRWGAFNSASLPQKLFKDARWLIAELRSTQAALTRAREALEKYGGHIIGECAKWHQPSDYSGWMQSDAECTCGFDAARTPGAHE